VKDRERAIAFLRETYRRRVERVETYPWGELVVTPSLQRVYDANFAIVDRWDGGAAELQREMDDVQGTHGFAHRKIVLPEEELAARLWPELAKLGWPLRHRFLLMVHQRPPDRAADASIEVLPVDEVEWSRGRQAVNELESYGSDPEVVRQLLDLDRRLAGAMDVHHLAALVDGEVASYAGLYLDGGVAQIEDVATLPAYRGRGLARAVILQAVDNATRAGAGLVFLVADEADWPKELYGRLGFDRVGVEHSVGRPAEHDS
jgi:GNAT superfamily N-acetyltransferase